MRFPFFEKLIKLFKESEYFLHETKFKAVKKFLVVFSIVIIYFLYVIHQFGLKQGFLVTLLTWTFFVFCTPIADAGFLIDFPVRLFTNVRMIYSELMVWIVAFFITLFTLLFKPELYDKTPLLVVFKDILLHPWPFWSIILLSASGTFLSVLFGDELIDVAKHEEREKHKKHHMKHKIIVTITVALLVFVFYYYLIHKFNLKF